MIQSEPIIRKIFYPSSDGMPMADNTKQCRYITVIKGGLDALFSKDENVFIAGDLLWYPVQGRPDIATAPHVMVVLGRPKSDRQSYKQWEEDQVPPQVVFEILSPSNTFAEMNKKLAFYEKYGVQEYYLYDPENGDFFVYLRKDNELAQERKNITHFKSPLLQIDFELEGIELKIFHPAGFPFLSYEEMSELREREYKARIEAGKALLAVEMEKEKLLAENQKLLELLKQAGINPD